MTVAKGTRPDQEGFRKTGYSIKKQAVIFGAFISSIASATAIGYGLYVTNPIFQEFFIKTTTFNF